MTESIAIKIRNLRFKYLDSKDDLLFISNLEVAQGAHLLIEGASGSGKTTLLNLLAGVQEYEEGTIEILGKELNDFKPKQLDNYRANHVGIIFQLFNLIPYLSILENVMLPCSFSEERKAKALRSDQNLEHEALRLIKALGLDEADIHGLETANLSVGQQQRVAAARALMGHPEIIIADEPTSALDNQNTEQFMQLLLQECERYNSTLIFVSHDTALKSYFNQSLNIKDLGK